MRLRYYIVLILFVAGLILCLLAEYYQRAGDYELAYLLGPCGFILLFIFFMAIVVLLVVGIENASEQGRDIVGV
jgi:hypothetical protein